MNKKVLIVGAVALIIVVAIVLALSGSNKKAEEPHVHSYSAWETIKDPTCTVAGEKARYCDCGDTQTASLSATGHKYGSWEVITEATCTSAGLKEKVCSCGDKKTETISQKSHTYGEWKVITEATCTSTGSKEKVCACGDKKTETIAKKSHTYGEWIILKEATCTSKGSKEQVCSCGDKIVEEIPVLPHTVDNAGKCTVCGLVTLNMTDKQIEDSKKVEKMTYSVSEYSDECYINITLKDKNGYTMEVPVYVDVKIVNDNGKILYQKTLIKKASQSKVTIDYDDLTVGYTEYGTLYYTVYSDYVSFDTNTKELTKLPWTVDVTLPVLCVYIGDYNYRGDLLSEIEIDRITYKVSGDDIYFYLTGAKLYDLRGNNYSSYFKVGWKLYDENGYVVDSGTLYTDSLKAGDKFKEEIVAYNCIEQGKKYSLVLLDVI